MNGELYSENEKEEARKNGFILGGKTGAGKSTLLNALLGKDIAVVLKTSDSVTTKTEAYFYKLSNGKMITILDTPGLMDPKALNNPKLDNVHLDGIKKKICDERIEIKGIIFLVNFQEERFDLAEQEALINYNTIFPLKNFWKHILVIFTHYYGDPDGDNQEEMKEIKDRSNREILAKIMEKVKDISDVIDYKNLNTKYFNSYSPVKTEKQKQKNQKNKKELEVVLDDMTKSQPLFSKIEILTKNNHVFTENNKTYKGTLVITGFFGIGSKKPIYQNIIIYNKIEITPEQKKSIKNDDSNIKIKQISAQRDANGQVKAKENDEKAGSYYWGLFKSSGMGSILGAGLAAAGAATAAALLGPGAIIGAVADYAIGGGIGGAILGFIKGL